MWSYDKYEIEAIAGARVRSIGKATGGTGSLVPDVVPDVVPDEAFAIEKLGLSETLNWIGNELKEYEIGDISTKWGKTDLFMLLKDQDEVYSRRMIVGLEKYFELTGDSSDKSGWQSVKKRLHDFQENKKL